MESVKLMYSTIEITRYTDQSLASLVKTLSAITDSWRLKSSCYRVQKLGSNSISLTIIIGHSRIILNLFLHCHDGGMWWKVGRQWIKCFPHCIGHETKQIGKSHEKLAAISKDKKPLHFFWAFAVHSDSANILIWLGAPSLSLPKRQITQYVSLWLSCTSNTMVPEIGSLTPWYLIDSIRANILPWHPTKFCGHQKQSCVKIWKSGW